MDFVNNSRRKPCRPHCFTHSAERRFAAACLILHIFRTPEHKITRKPCNCKGLRVLCFLSIYSFAENCKGSPFADSIFFPQTEFNFNGRRNSCGRYARFDRIRQHRDRNSDRRVHKLFYIRERTDADAFSAGVGAFKRRSLL